MKLWLIVGVIVLALFVIDMAVIAGWKASLVTLLTGLGLAFFGYLTVYGYRGMKGNGRTYRNRNPV